MEFKEKITKENYIALKARHKAEAEISKALRLAANKNSGLVRYNIRKSRQFQRVESRIYHLALAFLKGRRLIDIEPIVDLNNKPRPSSNTIYNVLCQYVNLSYRKKGMEDELDRWLTGLPLEVPVEEEAELAVPIKKPEPVHEKHETIFSMFKKVINAIG